MVPLGDLDGDGRVTRGKRLHISNKKPGIQGQKLNELPSITHYVSDRVANGPGAMNS